MSRSVTLEKIIGSGVVAIVRLPDSEKILKIAEALHAGGITAIEITMNTPDALSVIREISKTKGAAMQVGVGSVLDFKTVLRAAESGASYVVSPVLKPEIIDAAHEAGMLAIPGCFSPTEIWTAHEANADIIKVFPAHVLGMDFIRAIKAPMPQLVLMPTGGITQGNAAEWIRAGANCVGVGGALIDQKAIAGGNFGVLTENALMLMENINKARK
jgi:2-dehydro-3-deoxyphosphogluconate aldolase/(4S)-4-hydroxy-2-oxoglutarate aldolase